jgi:hypothetical protein
MRRVLIRNYHANGYKELFQVKHYRQSAKRNCGQIAVASLTGKTVEEIEAIVGHSHGTKTKELAEALRKLGCLCDERSRPLRQCATWPEAALLQVRGGGRPGWHWVAYENGMVCDGHQDGPMTLSDYVELLRLRSAPLGRCDAEWKEHKNLHEDSTECRNWRTDGFRVTSIVEVHRVKNGPASDAEAVDEARRFSRLEIASVFQVPPELIGRAQRAHESEDLKESFFPEGPLTRAFAVCDAFKADQITMAELRERIAQERRACVEEIRSDMEDLIIWGDHSSPAPTGILGTSPIADLLPLSLKPLTTPPELLEAERIARHNNEKTAGSTVCEHLNDWLSCKQCREKWAARTKAEQPCRECGQTGFHKMSCDRGQRSRQLSITITNPTLRPDWYRAYVTRPTETELIADSDRVETSGGPAENRPLQSPQQDDRAKPKKTVEQPALKTANPHNTEAPTLGDKKQEQS